MAISVDALRKIEPLPMPQGIAKATDLGARPKLQWIEPTNLLVDATYQRDLSRRSIRLIRQMVEQFTWNRMKPPIVVQAERGFHIVDGQHTAIAAATIGLAAIPVFVVEAGTVGDRARAFVGHNTDRIVVSPIAIWKALLGAGDPDAMDLDNVCKRAGVRIRVINRSITPAEGDTMAIGTVQAVVKKRGVIPARKVMESLVKARRAPITSEEIRAAEQLICVENIDADDLTTVMRIEGDKGLNVAHAKARADRTPIWRELAAHWSASLKRRGA